MLGASLLLALREIRRHLLRSFLTVLGIVIGVAAVITMVTVGNGVTASVRKQISSLGANTLMITPNQERRGAGSPPPRPFLAADVTAIREQVGGIKAVSGQVQQTVTAVFNGVSWPTTANGTTNDGIAIQNITLSAGRGFTEAEEAAGKAVCLVGATVQKNLFEGVDPVGQTLRLNNVPCTVIGTVKERGQGGLGGDQDDVVMMPLQTVQRRLIGAPNIFWIVVGEDPAYDNSAISEDLARLLRERRHLRPGQADDFRLIDMKQISDTVSGAMKVLTGLVAAIASISLVVGGIGIVNIMLVSVTERTREIGIRLAIGALASEVRLQFLTEAVVLCALGGMVGVALAVLLSMLLTTIMKVDMMMSPFLIAGSLLFSSFLGVVFGYVPARRAASLNPIEALRHE